MTADFGDLAMGQHDDAVSPFDGRQAMRDDEGGATLHQTVQCGLDGAFGLAVEC